jgi:hypothetical protein
MRYTRWVTPEGHRIELTHAVGSSKHDGRGRTYGASWDGWRLTVKHPQSLQVLTEEYLGETVDEVGLRRALDAIDASPVDEWPPKPPPPAWVAEALEAGREAAKRWSK